jgi:hypothetical protein
MAKIKKVTLTFDEADLTGVAGFRIYYDTAPIGDTSPFVAIPMVLGQTAYDVILPTVIPLTDGTYNLGVVALDESGNESDADVMTRPFDFTPPAKPVWRR